jgi:hypothetical protein
MANAQHTMLNEVISLPSVLSTTRLSVFLRVEQSKRITLKLPRNKAPKLFANADLSRILPYKYNLKAGTIVKLAVPRPPHDLLTNRCAPTLNGLMEPILTGCRATESRSQIFLLYGHSYLDFCAGW